MFSMRFRRWWPSFALLPLMANAAAQETCPALKITMDPQGQLHSEPLDLSSPPVKHATSKQEDALPIPGSMKSVVDEALAVIRIYESGRSTLSYANVSGHETISLGVLQWNWGTNGNGSLITKLMPKVTDDAIEQAGPLIIGGLKSLKAFSNRTDSQALRRDARAALAAWHPPDSAVSLDVKRQLAEWLQLPAVKSAQDQLVDEQMRIAYALSKKWREQSVASGGTPMPVDSKVLTFFFDQQVFNGGRAGLWIEHVREYRQRFQTQTELIESAATWLDACAAYRLPFERTERTLYRKDATPSATIWRNAVKADPNAFSNDELDLFAFAILRAQRSEGSNPPSGFPGIYQADVLARRGTIALGIGHVHGKEYDLRQRRGHRSRAGGH